MGNECDQCEAVTEGCKRQQFRTEIKNRQKLDISRAQANQKSRSKLEPLLQLRNQHPPQSYPNDPDSQNVEQSSLEIIKHRKPPNQKQVNRENHKQPTPTFKQSLMKGSLKQKKSQLDAIFEGAKHEHNKDEGNLKDSNMIKLPIESGIQGTNMKRLEQLQKALMMSRQPPKMGLNNNKKTLESHSNSIVKITNTIEQSIIYEKQNEKENSFMKKNSMRNEPILTKMSSKLPDTHNSVLIKKTSEQEKPNSSKSKYQPKFIPQDSAVLQSSNPSKVLRQFNNSLQESPIHPIKRQPKSPINYEDSQIPYDQDSISENIQAFSEQAIELKPGVYFEGYISHVTKKLQNQGTFKFEADQTEMLAYFKNGSINDRKNVMLGFQDGSIFDGNVRKDTEKSEFMASGKGKFVMPDQSYYVGQWLKNLPHGKGIHRFPDGSSYQGQFIQGRKQGQGKFTTASNDLIYEGSFLNNRIEGFGIMYMIEPNTGKKRIYKGYFQNGKLEGDNCEVQYVQEKTKYVGGFKNGRKSGYGKYYYGDGRIWQGQWEDNRQNGYGKLKNQKGVEIEGHWIDGIKSQGRMSKR